MSFGRVPFAGLRASHQSRGEEHYACQTSGSEPRSRFWCCCHAPQPILSNTITHPSYILPSAILLLSRWKMRQDFFRPKFPLPHFLANSET